MCEEELQGASVLTVESLRGMMEEVNLKRHSGPFLAGPYSLTEDSGVGRNSRRDSEQLGCEVTWVPTRQLWLSCREQTYVVKGTGGESGLEGRC